MARKRSEDRNGHTSTPPTIPVATARRLAPQPDYLPSVPKLLTVSELRTYNGILQHEGKEAADNWLTLLWPST